MTSRHELQRITKALEGALPRLDEIHRTLTAAVNRASSDKHRNDLEDAAATLRHFIDHLNVEYRLGPQSRFLKPLLKVGVGVAAMLKTIGKGGLEGTGFLLVVAASQQLEAIVTEIDTSIELDAPAAGDTSTGEVVTGAEAVRQNRGSGSGTSERTGSASGVASSPQDATVRPGAVTARAEVQPPRTEGVQGTLAGADEDDTMAATGSTAVRDGTVSLPTIETTTTMDPPTVQIDLGIAVESDQALPVSTSKDIPTNDALGITDDVTLQVDSATHGLTSDHVPLDVDGELGSDSEMADEGFAPDGTDLAR